jgi:hypothetical protein
MRSDLIEKIGVGVGAEAFVDDAGGAAGSWRGRARSTRWAMAAFASVVENSYRFGTVGAILIPCPHRIRQIITISANIR